MITGTSTNSAGGWNSIIAPTQTTFTAFNFSPQSLPPAELVGQVDFTLPDGSTSGVFDVVVTAFSLDGVDMPSQSIGTISVVAPFFADGFETGDTTRWSDAVP